MASMIATLDGDWIAITPAGFFAASGKGADQTLSVVRGLDATTIGQVHQSLFSPDLVREALAGDPDGEVQAAAKVIDLEKVLDSGPTPLAEIASHPSASNSDTDVVTIGARITDKGKGIGRIEWRVNGVTVGVANAADGAGRGYEVKQDVALDPGENKIQV